MPGKKWTVAEESIVRELYPVSTIAELMLKLPGRSWRAIYNRAYILEVEKDIAFLKSEKCGRFQKGTNNAATQFKKGHTPFNKGKKGVYFGGEKTQFKKGSLPHNTKYDGAISERPHKNGTYLYIRVEKGKWQLLQRNVWEQHNPPIQKGEVIAFKDGDYKNCDISNLMLLTRKDNMKRNSIIRYPEDIRKAIHTVAKLNRTIQKKENGTK
jgi:hypothetical protein